MNKFLFNVNISILPSKEKFKIKKISDQPTKYYVTYRYMQNHCLIPLDTSRMKGILMFRKKIGVLKNKKKP